ncbi:MAG: penicillin-binding protein 2 [Thermodesulfobacteriaceae bacterium]|jgi:penicillin-binding protein 2
MNLKIRSNRRHKLEDNRYADTTELEIIWKRRIFYVQILLFVILLLLIGRAFQLQILKHSYYLKKAKERTVTTYIIRAPRGEIITSDGVVVATNRAVFQLYLDPESIKGKEEEVLVKLSKILQEDFGQLKERYYFAKKRYFGRVLLKRDLSWDEVSKILVRQYYLPGVIVEVEAERYYPYGEAYFHLLGYVARIDQSEYKKLKDKGYSPEDYIGKSGIERLFEEYLRGENGRIEVERDAKGRLGKVLARVPPKAGKDLVISVNHKLQMTAYELLKDKRGAIVALSPKDGSLLALVSSPAVDPNKYLTGFSPEEWKALISDPKKPLLNRAIQPYPPGSTFKLVTALAGLQSGVIKHSKSSAFCSGGFPFGQRVFRCWERKGHGSVDFFKAIAQSCDVYFYNLGLKLDIDFLAKVARSLGLGYPTGLGFLDEKSGIIPDRAWKKKRFNEDWYAGESIIVAIGQGYVTTTPIQMAKAYSVLANGGYKYKVSVAREVRDKNGTVLKRFEPILEERVSLDPEHLSWLHEGLKQAVEIGTGKSARVPGLQVYGKTGTAQVVALERKRAHLEDHAWFVSFAGNSSIDIVTSVFVEHGGSGGRVAAPLAGELYRAYYGLPSQRKPKEKESAEEEAHEETPLELLLNLPPLEER